MAKAKKMPIFALYRPYWEKESQSVIEGHSIVGKQKTACTLKAILAQLKK